MLCNIATAPIGSASVKIHSKKMRKFISIIILSFCAAKTAQALPAPLTEEEAIQLTISSIGDFYKYKLRRLESPEKRYGKVLDKLPEKN